jgi:hypothetical protein
MSARKNLVEAYTSWEQLTQAESVAIARDDWSKVSELHQTKQGLQRQIIHLTEAAQAECVAQGQDPRILEGELRRIINGLIALESNNANLVAGRKQAAEVRRLELDQAAQNLRRIQKSYSPPAGALWNSYS